MKEKRKAILVSILGTLGLILMIVGATYAWFSTQMTGEGVEINVTTATKGPITFTGSEISIETGGTILPGWTSEDTDLTIEGTVTGSEAVEYFCTMENTGEVRDVEYRISNDGEVTSENAEWKSITEEPILNGSLTNTNSSDTYKIAIRFKETGLDQNDQQNKTLSISVTCDVEEGTKFHKKILADNPVVNTRTTFDAAFEESNNGDTIYKQDFTQDEKTYETYYFAGQVTNNYVKFGQNSNGQDLYWRIVRINEDNSVRMIYAGTSATDTAAFINTSLAFNVNTGYSIYIGYMYQVSGENSDDGVMQTETLQHGNATSSTIKKELDSWYESNLSEEDEYISKTAVYCNDRTVTSGTWNITGNINYAPYTRLKSSILTPTYACAEPLDRFSVSEFGGNGLLTKPIGLITADEVVYAGGYTSIVKSNYLSDNANNGYAAWWTMSPSQLFGGYAYEWLISSLNSYHLLGDQVHLNGEIRPVISLKSCVNWEAGDGTSGDPYTVSVSDECALKEN